MRWLSLVEMTEDDHSSAADTYHDTNVQIIHT